jgi:hypothetical protein
LRSSSAVALRKSRAASFPVSVGAFSMPIVISSAVVVPHRLNGPSSMEFRT